MIAFGVAVTNEEVYQACAAPGIERVREPDSELLLVRERRSLFQNYNTLLERAAQLPNLEALVLVHQDAEIVDGEFVRKVREALASEDVGVVGCVGAVGVRSIAWWEGSVTWASFTHRYGAPGEEFPSFSWDPEDLPPFARVGEVDTIDGFVMVLSPWVVRNLRFDDSLGTFHGYDLDFCLQVRASGKKVTVADFRVIHHHSLQLCNDPDGWIDAYVRVAKKWNPHMPEIGYAAGSFESRALYAEAERGAALGQAISIQLQAAARQKRHLAELEGIKASLSWRITKPLRAASRAARRFKALLRSAARGLGPRTATDADGTLLNPTSLVPEAATEPAVSKEELKRRRRVSSGY